MKKIILAIIVAASFGGVKAQFTVPGAPVAAAPPAVTWTFTAKKIAEKTYELHMTATIISGYHLYAQVNNAEGPVPTTFTFVKNPLLEYTGKVKEVGTLVSKLEPVWGFKVNYFENKVDFVQIVKSKVTAIVDAKGIVNFMVCNDKKCLPPRDVNFDIKIGSN
jgi:Disulphide bond corrector protein DsbC